jgi:hypothetical protein
MIEPNTREIAVLVWLGAILGFAMLKPAVRQSALGVVRALLQRKIVAVLGLATIYVAICVWILSDLGLWEGKNLKTTLVWGLTFAFVTMMDVKRLEQGPRALKALAKGAVSATVFVVFIAELHTLPLRGELLLVPFLTLLAGMLAVAEHRPENAIIIKPLTCVLTFVGLGILGFSVYHIVQDFRGFASVGTGREFAVPILLSLMFLPFLFALSVYLGYENSALRLSGAIEDSGLRRYAFWRGMLAFRTNLDLYQRFVRDLQSAEVRDRETIRHSIRKVRLLWRREKVPPPVPWSEGWSPYKARGFLADQGLRTNDYHGRSEDWWAESPMVDIGGDLFKDRLIFRIGGTETAVTRLSLELNAHLSGTPEQSDATFWETARLLVERSVGQAATEQFVGAASQDIQGSMQAGEVTIVLRRDDWGSGTRGGYSRRATIQHSQHREAFPGMD